MCVPEQFASFLCDPTVSSSLEKWWQKHLHQKLVVKSINGRKEKALSYGKMPTTKCQGIKELENHHYYRQESWMEATTGE